MEKTGTIYQYYNKKENKSYIGSTTNLHTRIVAHNNSKSVFDKYLQDHKEDFELRILEENIPLDDISSRELYYINLFNSVKFGYNKHIVGFNTKKFKNLHIVNFDKKSYGSKSKKKSKKVKVTDKDTGEEKIYNNAITAAEALGKSYITLNWIINGRLNNDKYKVEYIDE